MAQSTITHDRFDLATKGDNVRESLADVITNISPTEVPFFSNCSHGTAKAAYEEWLVDELATPNGANKQIDGDEFSNTTLTAAARLGNYAQISWKVLGVSRRADKLTKAGRKSEVAYQLAKEGRSLKRDVEAVLLAYGTTHQVAAAGQTNTAPTTASLGSWLKTNTNRGATGADPTLSGTTYGYPDAAPDDGTDRALTEDGLLGIIRDCYVEGGNPSTIMCGPTVKQQISKYMFGSSARIATPYQDHGAAKKGASVVGSVDVYVSDFGNLEIVPNRFQREDDVYVLDFDYWEIKFIDKFAISDVAKSGDGSRKAIICDYVLCSKNEKASGIYADVDESLAMTAS
jgi:hypothetical protein